MPSLNPPSRCLPANSFSVRLWKIKLRELIYFIIPLIAVDKQLPFEITYTLMEVGLRLKMGFDFADISEIIGCSRLRLGLFIQRLKPFDYFAIIWQG